MRRFFSIRLLACLLPLLLAAALPGCGQESSPGHDVRPGRARHIILFIGDGMQLENEIAASRYLYGTDYGLAWHRFPYRGAVTTWDVSAYDAYASYFSSPAYDEATFDPRVGFDPALGGKLPYPLDPDGDLAYLTGAATDSASAATALATGVKTDDGNIAWLRGDPAGGQLSTIAELMRAQRGAAIGVVTTVPFNHATPAAFVSHNVNRGNYLEIADEIISVTKPEVVIGGGHPDWCSGYISSAQLDALRVSIDYVLVERGIGHGGSSILLNAASTLPPGKKIFGLFGGADGSMATPVPSYLPAPAGFSVDPYNPTLDDSTRAALMVLSGDTGGFFLMVEAGDIDWANHTGDFNRMIGAVFSLHLAVQAAVEYVDLPGDDLTWDNTLIIVTADHATGGLRLNPALPLGRGELPAGGEFSYATGGHTNEPVTLYARGAGHGLFREYRGDWYPGTILIDNTRVFQTMARAADLDLP